MTPPRQDPGKGRVPQRRVPQGVLVYTVHKAASMFLHNLAADVSARAGLEYFSINNERDREEIRRSSWRAFIESGGRRGCFAPIRAGAADPMFPADLDDYSIVLHLRDPRDVLVSRYYSKTFSHPCREGGFNPSNAQRARWIARGIDAFVLENATDTKRNYDVLVAELLGRPGVVFLTYEQMVDDFEGWLARFLSVFEGPGAPPGRFRRVLCRRDAVAGMRARLARKHRGAFRVKREDLHNHKRQISPGDHRRKLAPETISALNQEFRGLLGRLGYPAGGT